MTTHLQKKSPIPSHPGVVIVIILLALALLVGIVLFVLNLGQQVNNRVVTQNAADNAAAAGAGWVARSFNTVAMNNVGMAQLIAAVQVVDSVPQAAEFAQSDLTGLSTVLDQQLARGIPDQWFRDALQNYPFSWPDGSPSSSFSVELGREMQNLKDIQQMPLQWSDFTNYNGPHGTGKFWLAMQAMDQYSQTVMENLGPLAQLYAVSGGATSDGVSALIVPILPGIPYKRGHLDDFERPVKYGLLPGHDDRCYNPDPVPQGLGTIDDKITNRGPYDTIFGWRRLLGGGVQGYTDPGTIPQGGHGSAPPGVRGWVNPNGTFHVTGRTPPNAYEVYPGPMQWAVSHIVGPDQFTHRFDYYLNEIAYVKLGYLWPGPLKYTGLILRGYRNAAAKAANNPAWQIPMIKNYQIPGWWDGPNLQHSNPPSYRFYLEDGVDTSSTDLVLDVHDLRDGTTQIKYISTGTMNWVYDVLNGDGQTVVMEGLGKGVNGNRFGMTVAIPTPLRQITQPNWIIGYPQAAQAAAQNPAGVWETMFLRVSVKSRFPATDGRFLTPGSWAYAETPQIVRALGWSDPMTWRLRQICNYIWRDSWSYQETNDTDIGLYSLISFPLGASTYQVSQDLPSVIFPYNGNDYTAGEDSAGAATIRWTDATGSHTQSLTSWFNANNIPYQTLPQTTYREDDIMFVAINNGPLVTITNPNPDGKTINSDSNLPAPVDLDHSVLKPNDAAIRRNYLTFLATAHHSDQATLWPTRFSGKKPYPQMVALTQAQVYNNHSWDLWTQMWGTQLETVQDYPAWISTLQQTAPTASQVSALQPDDVNALYEYLRNTQTLAPNMLVH